VRIVRQLPTARLVHARRFGLLGLPLLVESNDRRVLDLAETSFGRFPLAAEGDPLRLTVIVEGARGVPIDASDAPGSPTGGRENGKQPDAHRFDRVAYRTRGTSIVLAGRDHDAATIDLATGTAVAWIGEAALSDPAGLRYAFLEALAYWMPAYTHGYLTLHASGIARDGLGVILAGPAGAGKSTLAVAAARRGLEVFADDAVFVRLHGDRLEAWGTPWVQRLLPESRELFPELVDLPVLQQPNGELKLEVELERWYPGVAVPSARPAAILALERHPDGPTEVVPTDWEDGPDVLWPYDLDLGPAQAALAAELERLPVLRLGNGGSPDAAIDALEGLLDTLAAAPSRAG
jgi:hypothetical protein